MPRRSWEDLRQRCLRLDGRGYKAYKDLEGIYTFPDFTLIIDHVQGDPFAAPTRVRVQIPLRMAGFPPQLWEHPSRRVGAEHYLAEQFHRHAAAYRKPRATGHSGQILMEPVGQAMLPRTAVRLGPHGVEARFSVGLPAAGRRVLGRLAVQLLTQDLPQVVRASLFYRAVEPEGIARYAATAEDADFLRNRLEDLGLVAFVADGSRLPRRSGVDDRPLETGIPFQGPPSLQVSVHLPNAGVVTGMGIPQGVTLIVGGGFHGKSTLLRALERGIYNHKPGDGRERVVSHPATVKIRAEDGRYVAGVDISAFINNLPLGQETTWFTTENASGSTSQAANIMEALEMGARVLLIDEDTAATNFMIRDRRMQALIAKEQEPITPYIDRARQLYEDYGVSTVLVLGGSGDYLDVADTVIAMDTYRPLEVTRKAREIAARFPTGRLSEAVGPIPRPARVPDPKTFHPGKGRKAVVVKAHGPHALQIGTRTIDLSAVAQLVETAQTRAIGLALVYAWERYMDGHRTLAEIWRLVEQDLRSHGLEVLCRTPYPTGDLAFFRGLEWAAALNRLRGMQVHPPSVRD